MYIVLEWVVGTGKSTQSKLLLTYLEELYPEKKVLLVREPWGTEIAEAIRALVQWTDFDEEMHALTDAYLYASARAQLLHTVILPALDAWQIVVSDRNVCSSLAYQWYTQWLSIERVWNINQEAVRDAMPDMVLFMDLDVATWLARTFDTAWDKWEREQQDFFDRAYKGYEALFSFPPLQDIMCRIDATGTEEEVFERIKWVIKE